MEVMVPLTQSENGGDDVVTRAVAVVKWLVAKVVSNAVYAERGLLHEEDTEDATVHKATAEIVPDETAEDGGEDETGEDDEGKVVLVLPDDHWILVEIGDVCTTNPLGVLLHDHPAEVRVEETFTDRVGVLVGVGVAMMGAVITSPPADTALDSRGTSECKEYSQWEGS